MKATRRNKKGLSLIFFFLLAVMMTGCKKDEVPVYTGYELVFTDSEGAALRSSKIFSELQREEVHEDIYFEGGVYWGRGEEAKAWLTKSFNEINQTWKDCGGESCYVLTMATCGNRIGEMAAKDSSQRDTNFKAEDVERYVERHLANLQRYDSLPGISSESTDIRRMGTFMAIKFGSAPTMKMYTVTKVVLIMAFVTSYQRSNINNNRAAIAGFIQQATDIVSIITEYDQLFHASGLPQNTPRPLPQRADE